MSTPDPETRRPLMGLAIVGIVVIAGFAFFMFLKARSTSNVSGALTIGQQALETHRCRSGKMGKDGPRDRPEFRGVELLDDATDRAVRVVEDPVNGTAVLVVEPGSPPQPVERAKCQRFDVTLRETGELIMEVWGMEGSLDIDCPKMRGSVRFERCYGGR